jgi:hypothetical protein
MDDAMIIKLDTVNADNAPRWLCGDCCQPARPAVLAAMPDFAADANSGDLVELWQLNRASDAARLGAVPAPCPKYSTHTALSLRELQLTPARISGNVRLQLGYASLSLAELAPPIGAA